MKEAHLKALGSRHCYFARWYFDRIVLWNAGTEKEISIPLPKKIQEAMRAAYSAGQSDLRRKINTILKGG